MESGWVETDGARLRFAISGTGPDLLFLNGTGSDLRDRPGVLDCPLTHRFRLITFDLRGMGQTECHDRPWTMATYAADAKAVLTELNVDHAHVLGYSFGGMVAQHMAIRYPDCVERLVLAATTPGGAGGSSFPIPEWAELPRDEAVAAAAAQVDLGRTAEWRTQHPERWSQALVAWRYKLKRVLAPEAQGQLAARAAHDVWDALHLIQSPTLVVGGTRDGVAPSAAVRALASRISGVRLSWMAGGHGFPFEVPAFFDRVAEFLTQ